MSTNINPDAILDKSITKDKLADKAVTIDKLGDDVAGRLREIEAAGPLKVNTYLKSVSAYCKCDDADGEELSPELYQAAIPYLDCSYEDLSKALQSGRKVIYKNNLNISSGLDEAVDELAPYKGLKDRRMVVTGYSLSTIKRLVIIGGQKTQVDCNTVELYGYSDTDNTNLCIKCVYADNPDATYLNKLSTQEDGGFDAYRRNIGCTEGWEFFE